MKPSSYWLGILVITLLCASACTNQSVDGDVYQIQIVAKPVATSTQFETDWISQTAQNLPDASLFKCENPGFEFGYVSIARWDNFKALSEGNDHKGRPSDKLHRAYNKIGSIGKSGTKDQSVVITVFDYPVDWLGNKDLKPNWDLISEWMKNKEGFVGASFYESLSPDATYRFINIAYWAKASDPYKVLGDKDNFFNEIKENSLAHTKAKTNLYKLIQAPNR